MPTNIVMITTIIYQSYLIHFNRNDSIGDADAMYIPAALSKLTQLYQLDINLS